MYHAHNFYPEFLVHNGRKVKLRNVLYDDWRAKRIGPQYEGAGVAKVAVDYAPKMIADRLMDYIRNAGADKSKPFFAYYALNIPHANNEAGGENGSGSTACACRTGAVTRTSTSPIRKKASPG